MKNRKSIFVILLSSALIQHVCAQIDFAQGSTFKYLKGNATNGTPAELLATSYNDASWISGAAPFRYADGSGGTVLSDMKNLYSTFFLRTNFTAQKAENIKTITFTINYDDAFVIVINGITALSVNAPTSLSTTSLALANHESGTNTTFTVDASDLGLVNGENSLSVMVLNVDLGSSDIYFDVQMSATPETPSFNYNNNVIFSKQGGYDGYPFILTLSSPLPDCNILYTIDGSDPKTSKTAILAGNSMALTVNPTQSTGRGATPGYIVRASLVKSGYFPSNSTTNTYIFLNMVKTQTYPGLGWPSSAVNGQVLDYEMATDVVNSALYSPYTEASLKQIPSISIVTDMDNLFSAASGIYVNATQSGKEWERPCSIELIETTSGQKFQINAGVRIRGAASANSSNPKHAFRFFFREEYGAKKLHYPLFEDEGADEFDRVDLRCEQNYAWSKEGSKYNNLINDIFSRDLQGKMGHPYTRGRYYHLYLNGMYWGIFQTDERAEASYASTYLGGNKEDYDVIKANSDNWPYYDEATDGNMDTWSALWTKCGTGFETNANYFALLGKKADGSYDPNGKVWVDVDNLIDYMLVIFYTGNFDAPVSAFNYDDMPNNFYALYNRNDKTKGFRFLAHDSEHSLFVDAVSPGVGIQENRVNIGSNGSMNISKMIDFNPQWLHYKMSKNAEYKARFMDRAYHQLTKGGLLTTDYLTNLYKSRAAQIDLAIIAESARWGDAKTSPSLTKSTWLTQNQSIYDQFFPKRTDILKQQLLNEGLYTSMLTPDITVDGVSCFDQYKSISGNEIIKIIDPNALSSGCTIYYTLDDTDPRIVGGGISASATSGSGTLELSINQTTVLNARLYKSGTWGPLKKVLFSNSNEDFSKLKVTEVNYHPIDSIIGTETIAGDNFEFIEFKNTGNIPIDISGLRLDSAIYYQFPDEMLLSPGAFYVIASKPNIFFSKYQMYPSGNFSKNLSNTGEEVVLFDRNNNVVLSFTYDDKYPWPTTADGEGFTLTSKYTNPSENPNSYEYWMASSTLNGSPFSDDINALTSLNAVDEAELLVRVYPNPTKGLFYVNAGQMPYGTRYKVSIYDTKGALILQNEYENTAVIDLKKTTINDGVYIVKIQTPTRMATQKIIYMH